MCGENPREGHSALSLSGSSPRVRGKPTIPIGTHAEPGLIPACAGKTLGSRPSTRAFWAHPRVCGENRMSRRTPPARQGSSPRVRGKRQSCYLPYHRLGLIPACAGKTCRVNSGHDIFGAHPRVCGENPERSGVLTLRSVRSWKTLSFPPSLKVTHCRAFVQLSRSRIRLRILAAPLGIVRPHHQSNPFEINWFPWITPRQKREPLLIARAIHHHRTAGSHVLSDDRPQTLTHTSAQSPNKDSRRNLK